MTEGNAAVEAPAVDKIIPALLKARADIGKVAKSAENKFGNYKYSTLEDYIVVIEPALIDNDLFVSFGQLGMEHLEARPTKKGGKEYPVVVDCKMTVYHKSGQSIVETYYGEAQEGTDKALYQAITGCRKYALASFFNLICSDDPEANPKGDEGTTTGKKRTGSTAKRNTRKKDELAILSPADETQYNEFQKELSLCQNEEDIKTIYRGYADLYKRMPAHKKEDINALGARMRTHVNRASK